MRMLPECHRDDASARAVAFPRACVFWLSVALVAGALAAPGCSSAPAPEDDHDEPIDAVELTGDEQRAAGIVTARVEVRPITRLLTTTGVVTAAQNRIAHIRPLARGIIQDVDVRLGDRVAAGDELLEYDNIELGDLIGEYAEASAGIERLEARRNVAARLLARAEALLEVEAISRSEYDLRQAEHEQAVADLNAQRAALLRVEEKLHRFGLDEEDIESLRSGQTEAHRTASHDALVAPFDGVITYFDASVGEIVDRERELFTLVDTSTVWVLGDIYEKDLGLVAVGSEVQITVPPYPEEVFTGVIEYVADFLDPESRTAKVRCVVANDDRRLKLQMYASVAIPVTVAEDARAVPIDALQTIGDATVVFVQESAGRFVPRDVRVGARGDEWAQILEGLQPGDTVVAGGSFYLKSSLLRGSIGDEH